VRCAQTIHCKHVRNNLNTNLPDRLIYQALIGTASPTSATVILQLWSNTALDLLTNASHLCLNTKNTSILLANKSAISSQKIMLLPALSVFSRIFCHPTGVVNPVRLSQIVDTEWSTSFTLLDRHSRRLQWQLRHFDRRSLSTVIYD